MIKYLLLFTPTPTTKQGDSTKNCPHCGHENGHYYYTVNDEIEAWHCDKCGLCWGRPINDEKE